MNYNEIGSRRLTRALLAGVLGLMACGSALAQEVNLCPGQLTGRVRIGARDIEAGTFTATSTNTSGLGGSVALNGTVWNGTDLGGPLDPDGYTLSVQSDLPGCDPVTSNLVLYTQQAQSIRTTSGFSDYDYTDFPAATGITVPPGQTTVVEFREQNPWILDASVTNLGCSTADMTRIYVYAVSNTNGSTVTQSGYADGDSRGTTDGNGHEVRYLDMPLVTGTPNPTLNTFTVQAYAYFSGATTPSLFLGYQTVGPADVDQNGHIAVHWDVLPECPACLDANLVGNVTLNGLPPADGPGYTWIAPNGTAPAPSALSATLPGTYDVGGGMGAGRYYPYADSYFNSNYTFLRWPYSTRQNYDGSDGSGPYVDLACAETDNLDFEADAAWIEGNMTYTCQARYEPNLVNQHFIYGESVFEGQNPDGSYIGSYGGVGYDYLNPATGVYRLILTAGTWHAYQHYAFLYVGPSSSDPAYPDFVNQSIHTVDNRYYAPSSTDPRAIPLAGGQTFARNFDYEMSKLVFTYTITGNTPAERELRQPRLNTIGSAVYDDPNSSVHPVYYVDIDAYGEDVVTELGKVTVYLPKGSYRFQPSAIRQIDGSTTIFPEIDVDITGCIIDTPCTGCPEVQWMPAPDTCGGAEGRITGTASDPDGIAHVAFRVNSPTPGENTPDGYTNCVLTATGGPDNEVSFDEPLLLDVGANTVELEVVDNTGKRRYQQRTVYRSSGVPPALDWTSPPDGDVTGQPTVAVEGSAGWGAASAGVKIDFVKVNGVEAALAPDPSSSNPNDRLFQSTLVLNPGPNTITVEVCDVCGHCTEETRTVTQTVNHPPLCDAGGPYTISVGGGSGFTAVTAAGSSDPDEDPLQYSWSTDCTGGVFSDRFDASPTLTVGAPPSCTCLVRLIVNDPSGATAECSSQVTLVCDDNDTCTSDACDPVSGCSQTAIDCNDDNACTDDSCDAQTGCVNLALSCDDGNVCTDDACNPTSGCMHTNNTAPCGDGDVCNGQEVCVAGTCGGGTPLNCDDGDCCTIDTCQPQTGCGHVPNTAPPVIDVQPAFSAGGACAFLWPPQHGYVDLDVENTGIVAHDTCGPVVYSFASCASSQPENTTSDGNSLRDCVMDGTSLHLRAERRGDCSPLGRVYTTAVQVTNGCGVSTTSQPLTACVWHDRSNAPPAGSTIYSANPASNQSDTRPGVNGTYGTDCGPGCGATCSSPTNVDLSDPDRDRDGVPMHLDNCPDVPNAAQRNANASLEPVDDVVGDACDANDALVDNMRFAAPDRMVWAADAGSVAYNVYRGDFPTAGGLSDATCLGTAPPTGSTDSTTPPNGQGFYYLATTVIAGEEGSPGYDSTGTQRQLDGSCP